MDRMHHSQFEHLFPELWELCHLQGLRFGPRAMFCTYGTTLNQFVAWTLYEEIDWLHDHKSGWNIYHSGIKSVQKNTLSRNVSKAKLVLYRWDYFSRLFFTKSEMKFILDFCLAKWHIHTYQSVSVHFNLS